MRTHLTRTVRRLVGVLALGAAGTILGQGVPEPGIVLYGKVWSKDGQFVAGSLTWRYAPAAGTSVEVTAPLQDIVTPAGERFSYRVCIPAESAVPGYPLGANVLPVTEAVVEYTRAAFVDGAAATIAGGWTTDTFSADERGKLQRVDLAVGGEEIPTSAISGAITYAGRQAGSVLVQVSTDPAFAGVPTGQVAATPAGPQSWQYAVADLPAGAYYIRAFRDTDGDGQPGATEAQAVYGLNPAQVPPDATSADVLLVDPDSDHDGLPDWWEVLRPGGIASGFGADDDGDGAWNGLEYAADTDPDDEDSAPGPVAWWPLDDGGGVVAADASGNGHIGALANGPAWTAGIRGGALGFDGLDDQVTVPSAPDLGLTTGLTLQAWVRRSGARAEGGAILSLRDDSVGAGYSLEVSDADGSLELHLDDWHSVAPTATVPADRWVHVAATFDAGTGVVTLYLDGRPHSVHQHPEPCATTALDLRLGSSASGDRYFCGLIDEPKVFGYARSAVAIGDDAFAITAFALNGGAAAATSRAVTLDNLCGGNPTEYMASESIVFSGASWQPYAAGPAFTLSAGDGPKTVYLRVRSANAECGPVADAILLDTAVPAVTDVNATAPDGIYGVGSDVGLTVSFSEPVMVTGGTPQLTLETGTEDGVADYVSGSGTAVLTFRYTVGPNQSSADLDATGPGALGLNGAMIADAAGNEVDLTLPSPGSPHSLGANRAIAVGDVHTVTYGAGPGGHIDGVSPQIVVHGGNATAVTAVPEPGYVFDQWSDDPALGAERTDEAVDADIAATASFRLAETRPPDGTFTGAVTAAAARDGRGWWCLTGVCVTTGRSQPLTLDLVHDPTGKLTGTAIYTVAEGTDVTMPIRGAVKGTRGSLTMKGSLKGTDPGKTVTVALTLNLALNAAERQLTGRLTGWVRTGAGSDAVDDEVTLSIPADMDGTWTLRFDLGQAGRTVTGTATLTLANGDRHSLVVKGRTAGGSAAALSLTGDPSDPAAKAIRIRTTITPLEGSQARLEAFSGKGYGQSLGW